MAHLKFANAKTQAGRGDSVACPLCWVSRDDFVLEADLQLINAQRLYTELVWLAVRQVAFAATCL